MAGSRFLNTVSGAALSFAVAVSGGVVAAVAVPADAYAAVVRNITVNGTGQAGSDAIKSKLTIKPGQSFTDADINQSIRNLYSSGYFSDVKISVSGSTLVVNVTENQLINQVVFNGNRKVSDKKLEGVVQLHSLGPYNQAQAQVDIQNIKDAYASIGRSDVEVTIQTATVQDNRINVAFVIDEGGRTKTRKINFEGNNTFGDARLASVILTKRSTPLSFLTRKDIYNPDKLRQDEKLLRDFYNNHGFPDYRLLSTDVDYDETDNSYSITFNISEGDRYKFGDIGVETTVEGVDISNLKGDIKTRTGKIYDADDIQKTSESIAASVSSQGYPFAQVNPRGDRSFTNDTYSVNYEIDQGMKAYIERIDIVGNTRTRDYVIRREFDLAEGDAYNREMIARTKRRLEALGYFSSVEIKTLPGSAPDRVVLEVDVVDEPTGSFSIGAGYDAEGDSLVLELSVEERNFLGRGQYIRASAGLGDDDSQIYNFSFTEPFFLGYRLAAGFDIYRASSSTQEYYNYAETAGAIRLTAPLTDNLYSTVRYSYQQFEYDGRGDWQNLNNVSQVYQDLINGSPWVVSSLQQSFNFSTVDNRQMPREGVLATLNNTFAGLGGDSHYYKLDGKARWYQMISDQADIIGSLTARGGFVTPFDDNLNVFDQFTIGGQQIRGFKQNGIGPRTVGTNDALGSQYYATLSAETNFPLPGIPEDINLRGAAYVDAGSAWGNAVEVTGTQIEGTDFSIRASAGVGLIWNSPFGDLRFDYAVPFAKEDFDETQRFRFGIANTF
ncbi:MAG: outer membrane protein assembly factor BamA [Martelella sp.]|uniref:Outer membrane protein assembly factor BamA n=1 Tax=Martelella mediterranea DSM 17316 TaxID=1122214 RepID=A0A1U9Z488_9HYPH|nr:MULTISPECIES: outer membrane protein assembly factor BamA [Martelella]AQZ52486.1 Outer membrane protein Omp85 [Martelella mediterranea DSM 17316]MAU21146.1 outer membrane protein assembly factor BamA [Martelella sp.]